jgi:hypothetical protein
VGVIVLRRKYEKPHHEFPANPVRNIPNEVNKSN